MRLSSLVLAATLIAGAVPAVTSAQIAPTPDGATGTEGAAGPGANPGSKPGGAPLPSGAPSSGGAGLPSDVRETPPASSTQAPPATSTDTAPAEGKAKGRARPSSTAKTPPR